MNSRLTFLTFLLCFSWLHLRFRLHLRDFSLSAVCIRYAPQVFDQTRENGSRGDMAVSKRRIPTLADIHPRALPYCFTELSMFRFADVLKQNSCQLC